MIKTIGIVILMISVMLYAMTYYRKYKMRPRDIGFFIELITAYYTELSWSRKSMGEVLSGFDYVNYDKYISETKILLSTNSYYDSFIEKNCLYPDFCIDNDDKAVIEYFFSEIGKYGFKKEIELCKKTIDSLANRKIDAESEFKKHGPLSLKLGAALGVWIAILLI